MSRAPYVQIPPKLFIQTQERAINDALGRLSTSVATAETLAPTIAGGETALQIKVDRTSSAYTPTFTTSWFTMVRVTAQTSAVLTIEFSNPPAAGDTLRVVIQ